MDTIPNSRQEIARSVRAFMGAYNISRTKFAEIIGKSENTARSRLGGESSFSTDELAAFADHLGRTVGDLLELGGRLTRQNGVAVQLDLFDPMISDIDSRRRNTADSDDHERQFATAV